MQIIHFALMLFIFWMIYRLIKSEFEYYFDIFLSLATLSPAPVNTSFNFNKYKCRRIIYCYSSDLIRFTRTTHTLVIVKSSLHLPVIVMIIRIMIRLLFDSVNSQVLRLFLISIEYIIVLIIRGFIWKKAVVLKRFPSDIFRLE